MYSRKMIEARGLYGIHPFPVVDRNSFIMKILDEVREAQFVWVVCIDWNGD